MDQDFASGRDFIDDEKYKTLQDFTVYSEYILLTTRGTIGRCTIAPQKLELGVLHPCLIRMQLDNDFILNDWIAMYINESNLFRENVQYNSNTTTIDAIYTYTLKEIFVPLPEIEEQHKILRELNRLIPKMDQTIAKTEKQVGLLQEYRTALISSVVTGKVDVREEVMS